MTPTTPTKSPVDTIGEALEEARRIMLRDYPEEIADPSEYNESLDVALSALSSLSNQPAQTEGLEEEWVKARAMEVFPPDEVNDGCPWYGHRRAIEDIAARTMIRHLHKRGYLSLPRRKGEVEAITLQGEQSDPCGTITVMVKMSDGREVEAIRTCANSIYHMVSLDDPAFLPK